MIYGDKEKKALPPPPLTEIDGPLYDATLISTLYEALIENPRYHSQLISTVVPSTHTHLTEVLVNPVTGEELELLKKLELEFRDYEAELSASQAASAKAGSAEKPENELLLSRSSPGEKIFRETGPKDGWYTYYYPIPFSERCLSCHRSQGKGGPETPFCVLRINLPEDETTVWTVSILAAMISWAMVTLAVTLLIMHLIMRRLVISPLQHLRAVSEEIIRGKLDQRAEIDTDDEFRELADAFNRMLRHLTREPATTAKPQSNVGYQGRSTGPSQLASL